MFKTVIVNTGAQIAGKVITAATTLLVTFIIARTLGEAGYGEFTKIFVFVGYFYVLADFGLNTIFIKLAKDNPVPELKHLFGARFALALFLIVIAVIISRLLPFNPQTHTGFSPLVKLGIIIASITILTHAAFTSANAYFQKVLRYDLSTVAAVAGSLLILVFIILSTIFDIGLIGYVASYVLGGIIFVTTAFILIIKRTGQIVIPKFKMNYTKTLFSKAWPVGVALIVNLIYFRIDVFILAYTRSSVEVGNYGLAYQFFEATLAIPIFFANALYPLLNNLFNQNLEEFQRQTRSWLKLLTLFSVFPTIGLFIIAYLIPVIFQGRFTGSVSALQILSIGLPLFFISALFWHILIIYDRQKYLIYIYATGAIFNLVTNLIFIPVYGYLAAAIITVISEVLITMFLALTIIRLNKL
ncbi:flippase [Candidatus Curtissbacteria bacterium]|nr:flippase [Candidatus Curtissbacteria bacterium]